MAVGLKFRKLWKKKKKRNREFSLGTALRRQINTKNLRCHRSHRTTMTILVPTLDPVAAVRCLEKMLAH